MKIKTNSALETKELAYKIGLLLKQGSLLILKGDLGAGKTTFTQGLAKALEIKRTVSSPTFTIMKVYEGKMPLYHIDAYRLEGITQDLGFEEMFEDDGVCVVEWPVFIENILPKNRLEIEILNGDGDERFITLIAKGERYEKVLEDLV